MMFRGGRRLCGRGIHGDRVAAAAVVLMLCALLSAAWGSVDEGFGPTA